jgi:hypothetical protein
VVKKKYHSKLAINTTQFAIKSVLTQIIPCFSGHDSAFAAFGTGTDYGLKSTSYDPCLYGFLFVFVFLFNQH